MNSKVLSIVIMSLLFGTFFVGIMITIPESATGAGFVQDSFLVDSHASFWGEAGDDESGYAVAIAGDVNGDGYDDILIGAPLNDDSANNAGQAYLVLGNASGWSMDFNLTDASASFLGEAATDEAGFAVAGAGDVNGDGYDDILIGAHNNDDVPNDAGKTYLILGKASGWAKDTNLANANASFLGEANGDEAGYSVAGAGDVNGDGYDDILFGAYMNDEGPGNDGGQTYLILGKASGWAQDVSLGNADASFWGQAGIDNSGWSVAGAGDVNADGYDDILIGAPLNNEGPGDDSGQTYLIFGKATGWTRDVSLGTADASFQGQVGDDSSGTSVAGAGDVDGDGYDDFLIGAPLNDEGPGNEGGQSYLIFGKASGWAMDTGLANADASFWGQAGDDYSGSAVAGAGDVNGDGYDDLLIGALENNEGPGNEAGQTYLILGKASGWGMDTDLGNADASFWGEAASDFSGVSVAGAGDVNGDGYDDILIGAYLNDEGSDDNTGQTYLIFFDSKPLAPKSVNTLLSQDGDSISVSWNQTEYWKPLAKFIVYRSMDGTNYYEVTETNLSNRSYLDQDVDIGKTYYYAITTVDISDHESEMSPAVYVMCDMDTDLDNIGNNYDDDDDGDGYSDGQDKFPLNATEHLDFDNDGVGDVNDPDDDNDGIPDLPDPEPLNPLNNIQDDIDTINTNIDTINTNINTIDSNIDTINTNIDTIITNLDVLNTNLNDLSNRVNILSNELTGINNSIHTELTTLAAEIDTFQNETETALQEILVVLNDLGLDVNFTEVIDSLNNTINNLESTSLAQIKQQLADIKDTLDGLELEDVNLTGLMNQITALETKINTFSSNTDTKLDEISDDLDEMDGIKDTIDEVKSDQDDLDKKQSETADVAGSYGTTLMIVIILLVIVLIMLAMVLMRSGKGIAPAPVPTTDKPIGRPRPRPRPSKPEPEPDEEPDEEFPDEEIPEDEIDEDIEEKDFFEDGIEDEESEEELDEKKDKDVEVIKPRKKRRK